MEVKTKNTSLSYKHPVPVNGLLVSTNHFLEVFIKEKIFYLSVLPGFHHSSLVEIEYKIKSFFQNYELSFDNLDYSRPFFNTVLIDDFLNSISGEHLFSIESILYNLIEKNKDETVLTNALYYKNYSFEENAAKACLKIKIRPNKTSQDETLVIIKELLNINPKLIIRLDGNRQFELNDLLIFCDRLDQKIGNFHLDYIEEPFRHFHDFLAFNSRCSKALALDESVPDYIKNSKLLDNIPAHYPLIFKPSLIGLSPIYKWLNGPLRSNRRAIISTSYEHPSLMPGLLFLAQTANTQVKTEYHGLENYLS